MHRISLQMRQNSWERKFGQIHENLNKFALAALHIWPFAAKSTKLPAKYREKERFFAKSCEKFEALVKVWGEGRISDDASRMGKVLMGANLGSQVLTCKLFNEQPIFFFFFQLQNPCPCWHCVGLWFLFAVLHISKGRCSSFSLETVTHPTLANID